MSVEPIDPSRIVVKPLADRRSYIQIEGAGADPAAAPPDPGPLKTDLQRLAASIRAARDRGAAVVMAYGAHLVKTGCGPLVRELIDGGWLTHAATQGAGIIHDWEFAHLGRSSESVRDNAPVGRFGTWDETGRWLNLAAAAGAAEGLGLGAAVGRMIAEDQLVLPNADGLRRQIADEPDHPLTAARADLLNLMQRADLPGGTHAIEHPWKDTSIPCAAHRADIPMTVHPGIGYDIINCHPLFCGAALGRGSGTDFHRFAASIKHLSGGVYLSVGSAIMSPQIFEKAFSVANNLLEGEGRPFIDAHHMTVIDLQESGGWDWSAAGEPPKDHPAYYLRWCKTFHRMGGRLDYLQADMRTALWNLLHLLRAG